MIRPVASPLSLFPLGAAFAAKAAVSATNKRPNRNFFIDPPDHAPMSRSVTPLFAEIVSAKQLHNFFTMLNATESPDAAQLY